MWFGTEGGLARFDGRRTQAISDSELPTGRVLSLITDQDGVLWIGTATGAARLTANGFAAVKETNGKGITSIISPERGRVLMSSEQGMIFECRSRADGTVEVRSLLDQPLQSADRDLPGLLNLTSLTLAGTKLLAGSLSRGILEIENGSARELQLRPTAYFVNALETDKQGQLWVGVRSGKVESGLYQDAETTRAGRVEAATGPVRTIRTVGEDVWVGTDGRGLFRFTGKKVQRFTFDGTLGGLRSDHVYSIFADREEVVWFGTDRGVCRYDPHAARVEPVGNNPESNFLRTIYQTTDGRFLAGTNRGLFIYDEATSTWRVFSNMARQIIYAISEDKNGRLLIGSAAGFFVGQRPSAGTRLEDQPFARLESALGGAEGVGSIRAIAQFRGAFHIASFRRGLERYEEGRINLIWPGDGPGTRELIALFADGDSRLLIGTASDGVLTFDGQQVKSEPVFAKLTGSAVRAIDRTDDGTLWFATNRGVYACRPQSECIATATDLDVRHLVATRIKNSEQSANGVWAATAGAGLLRISLPEHLGPILSHFDAEQGFPSQNVFAILQERSEAGNEQLLIGTSRGLVRYQPGLTAPGLAVTRVISKRIHGVEELQSGLSLEYPQNSLVLDVGAISSRTFPEQFQYAFILSDSQGSPIKQKLSRESQFAMEELKPGTYSVTARAFTKDLLPTKPVTFNFNVAGPPFPWTSTALAVLLALALLALYWAIVERTRIARTSAALVDANKELADARMELANEAERERSRIARDLHDQTLADLRHLLLLTDQLSNNGAAVKGKEVDAGALRAEIESISQEVRRICEDLSPSVLQNVGLAAALEFAISHAVEHGSNRGKLDYEFVCEEGIEERAELPANVQMQIYRIAQEAVSNICRHAGASYIKMVVDGNEGRFTMLIEDDGREFDPGQDKRSDGRGLANMRARASLIEAEISWSKRENGGNVFKLHRTAMHDDRVRSNAGI